MHGPVNVKFPYVIQSSHLGLGSKVKFPLKIFHINFLQTLHPLRTKLIHMHAQSVSSSCISRNTSQALKIMVLLTTTQ